MFNFYVDKSSSLGGITTPTKHISSGKDRIEMSELETIKINHATLHIYDTFTSSLVVLCTFIHVKEQKVII